LIANPRATLRGFGRRKPPGYSAAIWRAAISSAVGGVG
jgi:hypothetical protein